MGACGECLVGRHSMCCWVSVADEQPAEEEGYVSVDYYCCCGHEWTSEQMTLEAEYASYARDVTDRYGYAKNDRGGGNR